jgi:hypothetical protein
VRDQGEQVLHERAERFGNDIEAFLKAFLRTPGGSIGDANPPLSPLSVGPSIRASPRARRTPRIGHRRQPPSSSRSDIDVSGSGVKGT